jgi:disulfide bond formation protein DsbB
MVEQLLVLNSWVALGTLVLEIALAIFTSWFIFGRESLLRFIRSATAWRDLFTKDWSQMFLIKVFLLSLFSVAMTLVYSEYFKVVPCALCWFERIFMYGIVVMSGLGLWRKEARNIFPYINIFAIFGLVVSLYHHFLQMFATSSGHLPCPVSGGDCAKRIIFEYGHITFPWMAALVFVTIILTLAVERAMRRS